MKRWTDHNETERMVMLQQAADTEGLPEYAVEKDWWVTMVLKAMFQTSVTKWLEFKGGTSLSKGWRLIERFSEDIDLALSYRYFAEILENNNQLKMLRKRCRKFVVGYADYDKDYRERISFLPPESCIEAWRADYSELLMHFVYGNKLTFDELLERVGELNRRFNG